MRSTNLALVMSAVMWFVVPASASAQERAGFWFGVGGGYGSAGFSCDDCDEADREDSGVGYVKAGWTLNPRVLLGMEVNVWSKDDRSDPDFQATLNLYNMSGTVTYYPKPASGLFVKGGAGVAIVDLDVHGAGNGVTFDLGTGFGFVVGAGWDIPISRRVAITPAVNFWYGQPGNLKALGTTVAGNWKHNVVDFTIGITIP